MKEPRPAKGLNREGTGLSTKELLLKTGVSEPTLRRWLSSNTIPALRSTARTARGHRIWTSRHVEAIERYLQTQRRGRPLGKRSIASKSRRLPRDPEISLDALGIRALREFAASLSIRGAYRLSKRDLLKAIRAAQEKPSPLQVRAERGKSAETIVHSPSSAPASNLDIAYGMNHLTLLIRDATGFVAFWEVTQDLKSRTVLESGEISTPSGSLELWIEGFDEANAPYSFFLSVHPDVGRWSIRGRAGHAYRATLGVRLSDGRFLPLLTSNRILLPTARMSFRRAARARFPLTFAPEILSSARFAPTSPGRSGGLS